MTAVGRDDGLDPPPEGAALGDDVVGGRFVPLVINHESGKVKPCSQ